MKLVSCHIDNFGKISNLDMDFSDRITVINQPNAWGKSTLAAFIKVMFYGFDARKDPNAPARERELHRPWQGGTYGGELVFALNNRTYRVSRTFGRTEKDDQFHIYDCSTNLESVDFTSNLGEELFDLDATSFRRSVFIAQNDCLSQTSDGINAKLGNLVENTNDINNYESAQTALKNLLNQMSPTRATGSIKKNRNYLTQIEQELRSFDAAETAMTELQEKVSEAEAKKAALSEERDSFATQLQLASEESRRKEQQRNYLALCEDHSKKLESLLVFTEEFPYGFPEEQTISGQLQKARRLEELAGDVAHLKLTEDEEARDEKLSQLFSDRLPTDKEIDGILAIRKTVAPLKEARSQIQSELSEREKECLQDSIEPMSHMPKTPVIVVLGLLTAVLGIAVEAYGLFGAGGQPYAIPLVVAGIVVFFVGLNLFLFGLQKKRKNLKQLAADQLQWEERRKRQQIEVTELQVQEEQKSGEIRVACQKTEAFLQEFGITVAEDDYSEALYDLKNKLHEYLRIKEKRQQYSSARYAWNELRKELLDFGRSIGWEFGEDITTALTQVKTELAKYQAAKASVDASLARVNEFEQRTDMASLLSETHFRYSLEEINEQIHWLDDEIESVRTSIEQYNRQMEDLQEQLDLRDEKQEEHDTLEEALWAQQEKYEVLAETQGLLATARERFTSRYMAPISIAFRRYYELLLDQAQTKDWVIDANISFRRREQGELRDVRTFSAGSQDLIGICMRLALVEAMYPAEKPFLVLDDPFVNLDEAKTAQGMTLLNAVSMEYQVIYFTCHSSRKPDVY